MLIEWKPKAREALLEILTYMENRNPSAADDLQNAIETAVDGLPIFPFAGRRGREGDTRELVITANYILIYRVRSCIEIIDVLHARQQYPNPSK